LGSRRKPEIKKARNREQPNFQRKETTERITLVHGGVGKKKTRNFN